MEGYANISYIVVNHQGFHSQQKYKLLKSQVSDYIPVYQQEENQTDVWTLLDGKKDDFLVYDRCGRLVYQIGLPFSFLSFPYVEEAIKIAYCENKCGNCSLMTLEDEEFCKNVSLASPEEPTKAPLLHLLHHHHHHRHGHQLLGLAQPTEHQAPEGTHDSGHPAPPHAHHHHKHQGPLIQGDPEN